MFQSRDLAQAVLGQQELQSWLNSDKYTPNTHKMPARKYISKCLNKLADFEAASIAGSYSVMMKMNMLAAAVSLELNLNEVMFMMQLDLHRGLPPSPAVPGVSRLSKGILFFYLMYHTYHLGLQEYLCLYLHVSVTPLDPE